MYYLDKGKATAHSVGTGGQFPGFASISDGFVKSISHPLSKVKHILADVTESLQFKEWFGDSKIVDEFTGDEHHA